MSLAAIQIATEEPKLVKCACRCGTLFAPNPKKSNHKYFSNHRQIAYQKRQERRLRAKIRRQLRLELMAAKPQRKLTRQRGPAKHAN